MVPPFIPKLGVPGETPLQGTWEEQLAEGHGQEPDEGEEAGTADDNVRMAGNVGYFLGMQESAPPISKVIHRCPGHLCA